MRAQIGLALALVVMFGSLPSVDLEDSPATDTSLVLVPVNATSSSADMPATSGDPCPPSCLSPGCGGRCGAAPGLTAGLPPTVPFSSGQLAIEPPLLRPEAALGRLFRPPKHS